VTGTTVPVASVQDPASMVYWAGIAFARAFGAALLLVGACLWAANASANGPRSTLVPFVAAAFATWVVWVQQYAIWTTRVGVAFVCLIASLAVVWGIALALPRRAGVPN
jgi:hypothetical protein